MGNFAENLNLGNRFRPPPLSSRGGGGAVQLDSMWQHRLTRPLHVQHTYYRIIYKQNPFNIMRGSTLNLDGFSVKIIFHIIKQSFSNFLIYICKITCKPMGNFAENLNLGNRVRPPLLHNTTSI